MYLLLVIRQVRNGIRWTCATIYQPIVGVHELSLNSPLGILADFVEADFHRYENSFQ